MTCFLIDENNELFVGLAIEKWKTIELIDGEMWINGIIHIPTEDILEIKIKRNNE